MMSPNKRQMRNTRIHISDFRESNRGADEHNTLFLHNQLRDNDSKQDNKGVGSQYGKMHKAPIHSVTPGLTTNCDIPIEGRISKSLVVLDFC